MKTIKSLPNIVLELRLGVPQQRGLLHTLRYYCFSLLLYPYHLLVWTNQQLNIVSQEIRSLFGRIGLQHKGLFVVLGPGFEMNATQHLVPCIRTQARSDCISEMAAKRPWATVVDLDLLLEGWDKGEKWGRSQGGGSGSYIARTAGLLE